jgi:hypothetical protein
MIDEKFERTMRSTCFKNKIVLPEKHSLNIDTFDQQPLAT